MKKPDKTKAGGRAAQAGTGAAAGQPATDIRKVPAHPGVIESSPVGEGKAAQAGQPGTVEPIGSTLVGDAASGLPAAGAKPAVVNETEPVPDHDVASTAPDPARDPRDGMAASGSASQSARPASEVRQRKGGFWPMVFGGAVAAGLGAAATIYALPHLPVDRVPAAAATDQDALIAAAEEAGRRAAAEAMPADAGQSDLAERVAALEQAPADDGADQLQALQQRLDEQQARIEELAARPAFDPDAAQNLQQQIETAAADAQAQLDAARSEAQELQQAAEDSTRRAQAVAAISQLQAALDEGVTPDEARKTLEDAGLQTPEALTTEVPSLTSLQSEFPEAARGALRASLRDSSASGEGNVLTNFLRAQTGARSVEPREGNDADAILSRADAEVESGRIDTALTELQALPEPARTAPAMARWLDRATAHRQAQAALTDLTSSTN
ncbi:COG4223 family protein [Paracoccus beibuensis]|uniref:COG4223 family protein n=1 Tax=Paracoccus beibuensis TaxID=547602 RepID=UPI00223F5CF1|nr:hypothetical protein [Paracoccus beibuensis]